MIFVKMWRSFANTATIGGVVWKGEVMEPSAQTLHPPMCTRSNHDAAFRYDTWRSKQPKVELAQGRRKYTPDG